MSITPDQFRRLSATYHNSTAELHRMLEILDQHFDNCRLSDHPENLTGAQIAEFSAAMLRMRSAWIQIRSIIEESGRNTAIVARYWADNQCVLATFDEWQVMLAAAEQMVSPKPEYRPETPAAVRMARMISDSDAAFSPPVRLESELSAVVEPKPKHDVFALLFMLSLGIVIGAFFLR